MDVFKLAERLMAMDDAAWARHANPWSFWTRVPILPLLVLAVWSRTWIGWWCLLPIGLVVAWTFINPRAFGPPERTDDWTSKGVMGERLFLARKTNPIPRHHERWGLGLSAIAGLGVLPLIYGLWALDPLGGFCRCRAVPRCQTLVHRPHGVALGGDETKTRHGKLTS